MSILQRKLKEVVNKGKNIVFIGAVFVATVNVSQAQTPIQHSNSFIEKDSTTIYQKTSEHYELKNGVLMPNAGESRKDYEARRLRLKKQEGNLLNAQNISSHFAPLKEQNIDEEVINLIENVLQEQSNQPLFISFFSPEGKKRLNGWNEK